jgi:hypothetical protein
MARTIDAVDARLSADRATAFDRKQLSTIPPHFVFLIIDHETTPAVTATTPKLAFTPGAVTGRAYVFALQSGTIVCSAKIDARNTADDTYMDAVSSVPAAHKREAAGGVLHRELEIRIRQQLATELHATAR